MVRQVDKAGRTWTIDARYKLNTTLGFGKLETVSGSRSLFFVLIDFAVFAGAYGAVM